MLPFFISTYNYCLESPVIPAGFLLHEWKFQSVHEEFLSYITKMDPMLHKEKNMVADDEKAICNVIDKILPSVYCLRC